jgi:DNA-binding LacI/PurR family transcriptional regulator
LLFAMSNRDPQQEIEAADLLLDHQVDGLIVISSRAPHRYADLERRATRRTDTLTPVALVNNKQAGPHVYSVRADNEAGARAAVTYLRRLGHRSIAFLAGPAGGRSSQERLAGYHQGMRAGQREDMQELVLAGVGALDDGAAAMEQLLTTPEEPTAVLCYNDLAAIGLLAAASRAGVSVPHDLSVVGFDNISLSAHTSPPLTTVEQPTNEMGRSAVALCLAVLAGKQPNDMLLPVHIVMRNSAGRCRNR